MKGKSLSWSLGVLEVNEMEVEDDIDDDEDEDEEEERI